MPGAPNDFDVVTERVLADRAAAQMMPVEERGGPIPDHTLLPKPDRVRTPRDERAILHRLARLPDARNWPAPGDVFARAIRFDYGQGKRRRFG